ncbi:MAG: SecD, partial [Hyphomicrobiales bacterium]|nr:SecD [Hyphomicrobiales bacterium]
MLQFSPIRTAIIAIVTILGILFAIPNFISKDMLASSYPSWLPKQAATLGLDLQGGSYLLLEVNKAGIISDRLAELRRDARNVLANQNGIGNIITIKGNALTIELTDPTQRTKATQALQSLQNNVGGGVGGVGGVQELTFADTPDGKINITLSDQGISQRMSSLVTQSMEVIRKRIDAIGTTEPQIQRQGADRV